MNKLNLPPRSRALVIVAHPDDETIWFGGWMLANPQANWTILALCRVSDTDREPKFRKVCARYGANSLMEDWDDEDKLTTAQALKSAKKILCDKFQGEHFDFIFTHGANGEYGHNRHKVCQEAVVDCLRSRKFSTGLLLNFNYKKVSKYKLAPKADSDFLLKLSAKEYAEKIKIMSELYGFDPKGIDAGYSTNPEAIKIIKY